MIEGSNEKASLDFLKRRTTGHLGVVLEDGTPYVVPVNFLFKDKSLFIHSLPGKKITAMRANPNICLQADKVAVGGFEWESVIAFGKFEEIDDHKKKGQILREFYKKFPHFTPVEAMFEEDGINSDIIVFRINIERVTGMSEKY